MNVYSVTLHNQFRARTWARSGIIPLSSICPMLYITCKDNRGLALQEWLSQKDAGWLLSDQIATLYCIASIVHDLHSRDLVLCDLSPTSIAW